MKAADQQARESLRELVAYVLEHKNDEGLLLRPAATLPLETYSSERVHQFDEAEAELAAVLKMRGR